MFISEEYQGIKNTESPYSQHHHDFYKKPSKYTMKQQPPILLSSKIHEFQRLSTSIPIKNPPPQTSIPFQHITTSKASIINNDTQFPSTHDVITKDNNNNLRLQSKMISSESQFMKCFETPIFNIINDPPQKIVTLKDLDIAEERKLLRESLLHQLQACHQNSTDIHNSLHENSTSLLQNDDDDDNFKNNELCNNNNVSPNSHNNTNSSSVNATSLNVTKENNQNDLNFLNYYTTHNVSSESTKSNEQPIINNNDDNNNKHDPYTHTNEKIKDCIVSEKDSFTRSVSDDDEFPVRFGMTSMLSDNPFDKLKHFTWSNSSYFVIGILSSIIGTVHFSRFPFFLYFYNGPPFIISYLIVGFLAGVPLLTLLIAQGQATQGGICTSLDALHPRAGGIALAVLLLGLVVATSENYYHLGHLVYLYGSFHVPFPWTVPQDIMSACLASPFPQCSTSPLCEYNDWKNNCSVNSIKYALKFFRNDDMGFIQTTRLLPAVCIIGLSVVIGLCAWKGLMLLIHVGIWVLFGMSITMLFLFCFGMTLPGADYAMRYLLHLSFNDMWNPYMWSFATTQVLITCCISFPFVGAFASHISPRSSPVRIAYTLFILVFFLSILSALATFPLLGYLRETPNSFGLLEITRDSDSIVFSILPLALSILPGAPVFCFIFFATLCIGTVIFAAAQIGSFADEIKALVLGHKIPRGLSVTILAFLCMITGLSLLKKGTDPYWRAISFAATTIGGPSVCFYVSVAGGWGDGWWKQSVHVGQLSVLLHGFGYIGPLMFLAFINNFDCVATSQSFYSTQVPALLLVQGSTTLLALYFGLKRRRQFIENPKFGFKRKCETWDESAKYVSWWLFIGNTELLRTDLNEITLGALPLKNSESVLDGAQGELEENRILNLQQIYGKGFMCCGTQSIRSYWGVILKYVTPQILIQAVCFQLGHVHNSAPADPDFNTMIFGEIFETPESTLMYQRTYTYMLGSITLLIIALWLCPKLFPHWVPKLRITHQRLYKGNYELTASQKFQDFLTIFDELQESEYIQSAFKIARRTLDKKTKRKRRQSPTKHSLKRSPITKRQRPYV